MKGCRAGVVEGVEAAEGEEAGEGHVALFAGGEAGVVGFGDGGDVGSDAVDGAGSDDLEVGPVGGFVGSYGLAGCEVVEL